MSEPEQIKSDEDELRKIKEKYALEEEQRLKERLEELRRRDPFIYK